MAWLASTRAPCIRVAHWSQAWIFLTRAVSQVYQVVRRTSLSDTWYFTAGLDLDGRRLSSRGERGRVANLFTASPRGWALSWQNAEAMQGEGGPRAPAIPPLARHWCWYTQSLSQQLFILPLVLCCFPCECHAITCAQNSYSDVLTDTLYFSRCQKTLPILHVDLQQQLMWSMNKCRPSQQLLIPAALTLGAHE